jgi:hypothetical protein
MIVIEGKLPFYSREIRRFVKYLDKEHGIETRMFQLTVLDKDELDDDILIEFEADGLLKDGENWFGTYVPRVGHILIAARIFYPRWPAMILILVAHEYYHALQDLRGVGFDETQADLFANRVFLQYAMRQAKICA